MKSLNWGVIGPGNIAGNFAKAMAVCENGNIAAVASRSEERAKNFAEQYAIPRVYTDYAELVNDPSIDIIYVATPHSFHYEQAKLCINAGKHVLLEKPSTINTGQIKRLIELASEKGVLLQEALWTRFLPCMTQLKEKLDAEIIGDIQYINSDIGFAFPMNPQGRMFNAKLAGGALLDLGIYSIAVSQYLLSDYPEKIQATGHIHELGVDVNTMVNLSYSAGRFSQFTTSCVAKSRNEMSIVGTKGRVVIPACFWDTTQADIFDLEDELIESINIPHLVNGFEYQIQQTMQSVLAGKSYSDEMPHQASVELMQIMDEIRDQIGLQFPAEIEAI
ncbi:Gfo/Idh/MocA family protein [Paraglaciecola sp.]|uniref:Gfo/Idh/MocA family protein n=1 Tax=Paraglaciecola sp. TaxID=1920173 RepID=UPI003EF4F976